MAADPLVDHRPISEQTPPLSSALRLHRRPSTLGRSVTRAARRAIAAAHHPHGLGVVGLTAGLTMVAMLAGAMMAATWIATVGTLTYAALIGMNAVSPGRADKLYGPLGPPLDVEVLPGEVLGHDIRRAYEAVLHAHDEIRESLRASEEVHDILLEQYQRCGELVQLAGRIAKTGNTLQNYLDAHDPLKLARDVANLHKRATDASDQQAERVYRQTADAREQQLETYRQVDGFRDRIMARLELIVASLESVQVLIVKLRALVLEEAMFAGESISDGLDLLREDLELLESAMDEALRGTETDRFRVAVSQPSESTKSEPAPRDNAQADVVELRQS